VTPSPRFCRPDVHGEFLGALRAIDATDGLVRAATAMSRHELPHADARVVLAHLDWLGERVLGRARFGSPKARLAHLHALLFEEEGFLGNAASYYDPLNSYLPVVLSTHLGIPVSLALVYRAVAERIGLEVEGVGSPGHFLVRVDVDGDAALVDPFAGGRVLTEEEAFERIEGALGAGVPRSPDLLPAVTNVEWIARMIRNLESVFAASGRASDALAMRELRSCLPDAGS
jgi:regulator of sirC expression with transglutaminase-like and TPR domain